MISNLPPSKGLNIRILIAISIKGRVVLVRGLYQGLGFRIHCVGVTAQGFRILIYNTCLHRSR